MAIGPAIMFIKEPGHACGRRLSREYGNYERKILTCMTKSCEIRVH
jgi:hypothetical protein